jgi:hypothetical protein
MIDNIVQNPEPSIVKPAPEIEMSKPVEQPKRKAAFVPASMRAKERG